MPPKILASSFFSKADLDCSCLNIEYCYFDYNYEETGYPCYYDSMGSCSCSGPWDFNHCKKPVVEKCTRISGCGCECEESDCDNLCYTGKCTGCYHYVRPQYIDECSHQPIGCGYCVYLIYPLDV